MSATISVNNFSFSPSATLISTGGTITWQFQGGTHTVSGSGFNSGTKISGQTFSHTFNQSGNYNYVCSFHSSMTGTVKVE
ncbi:MAG: plastocyanin/azurin family copper-binding protein [Dehalococcoidia bacterium]